MSVETQAGYILLTEDIDRTALSIQKISDELDAARDQLDHEQNVTLPANRQRLSSWQAAGNSDMANKLAKIQESQRDIAATEARIAALKADIKEIGYELTKLQNLVKSLRAQRDAFERQYKLAIIEGKSPDQARVEAEHEAGKLQSAVDAALRATGKDEWYKNPFIIAGGVLVLAAIIYFIVKATKK